MKRLNHSSKSLVAFLLVLLLVLLPSFSEPKYEVTEEELTTLTTTLTQQQEQIKTLNLQLNNFETQLMTLETQLKVSNTAMKSAQTSLQIYENEVRKSKWKTGILVGGITLSICLPVGFFLGAMALK